MKIVHQISKGVLIPSNSQPFKIISDFKESGDQPEAINTLIKKYKRRRTRTSIIGSYRFWQNFYNGKGD